MRSIAPMAAMLCLLALLAACRSVLPPSTPVDTCVRACEARAAKACSSDECARGCEFILDRLVEGEGDRVVDCVGGRSRRCDDVVWADCAVRVGAYADGGPPAPPPPEDE